MQATRTPQPRLTIAEVCELLGISERTLARWRRRGAAPPSYKSGQWVRFDPAEVRAWLDAKRQVRENREDRGGVSS